MTLRLLAAALAVTVLTMPAAMALDQSLPAYQVVPGILGQIKSVGSDTLGNEVEHWAKGFMDRYPDVKIAVEAKGSVTAPPALLEGSAQFAPMSRTMTAEEQGAFEQKYAYRATGFRVAVDALAIYVNKDNPIKCLTMPQLNQIFSSTCKVNCAGHRVRTWGDVGLTGEWAAKPVSLYGRNAISGTYDFFRQIALYNGDFKPELKEQPGSEGVVQGVAGDRFAIGYSGIGFRTEGVLTVPLASYFGGRCYDTSAENSYVGGRYPLARYLYIYVNKKPGQPLDPLRREFIKYILSKDGQAVTEQGGFYPITDEIRQEELKRLDIAASAN
jgi:phosphate transport system substrate-binding protein